MNFTSQELAPAACFTFATAIRALPSIVCMNCVKAEFHGWNTENHQMAQNMLPAILSEHSRSAIVRRRFFEPSLDNGRRLLIDACPR